MSVCVNQGCPNYLGPLEVVEPPFDPPCHTCGVLGGTIDGPPPPPAPTVEELPADDEEVPA